MSKKDNNINNVDEADVNINDTGLRIGLSFV